jgi:5-methylcytosine-specific restriction endonuclease McrA
MKLWREAVFARDKWTCQDCGDKKGGNLEAHHIKSFAEFPELRFAIDNGITLCKDCHKIIHRYNFLTRGVRCPPPALSREEVI